PGRRHHADHAIGIAEGPADRVRPTNGPTAGPASGWRGIDGRGKTGVGKPATGPIATHRSGPQFADAAVAKPATAGNGIEDEQEGTGQRGRVLTDSHVT